MSVRSLSDVYIIGIFVRDDTFHAKYISSKNYRDQSNISDEIGKFETWSWLYKFNQVFF